MALSYQKEFKCFWKDYLVLTSLYATIALAEGRAGDSLSLADKTLRSVEKMSKSEVPNKSDVVANLHSCVGNAHLELGNTDKALKHHKKDLSIAEEELV